MTAGATLLATLLIPADKVQAAYVFQNVDTDRVVYFDTWLEQDEAVVFETTNLSASADTVMHMWDTVDDVEVAYNDNIDGSSLRSRVSHTNTKTARWFGVIVRARDGSTEGTADLYKNGGLLADTIPVEGEQHSVPCEDEYYYETAAAPTGYPHTRLFGLDADGQHLRGFDDNSGVGLSSRISGVTTVCSVVVGAGYWGGSPRGPAHLYVNDHWNDRDGDGLGAYLEAGLGTCDDEYDGLDDCGTWTPDCADVVNLHDTDRDGLRDSDEVFGIDDAENPQYLSKWGATATRKDIFVEVDWKSDVSCLPAMKEKHLEYARDAYAAAPADHIRNPDCSSGVGLHVDTGVNPSDPALATLYGDWGGANEVPADTTASDGYWSYMEEVRQGPFRYGLANNGNSGAGSNRSFTFGDCNRNNFIHELGHTVFLGHWGHKSWGKINCKPHYKSIMNYPYQGTGEFSTKQYSGVLDPTALAEDEGVENGTSAAFLASSPYWLLTSGDEVDWNRDEVFTEHSYDPTWGFKIDFVRAPVTWAGTNSCAAFSRNTQRLAKQTTSTPIVTQTTPALVRRADRLYAFWVNADGEIVHRQGVLGPDSMGSCNFQGLCNKKLCDSSEACIEWEPTVTVPTSRSVHSVSATLWDDGGSGTVVLAYNDAAGSWRELYSLHASTVDSSGNLTGWSSEERITGAYSWTEPELAVLQSSSGPRLAVFYKYDLNSDYYWNVSDGPSASWSSASQVLDSTGNAIVSTSTEEDQRSPTIATIHDGSASQHCAIFPDDTTKVRFHCYEPSTDRWADLTSNAFDDFSPPTTDGKPGLAYHVFRDSWGSAIRGDATEGMFHLVAIHPQGHPQVWLSRPLSAAMPANPNIDFGHPDSLTTAGRRGKFGTVWDGTYGATGIALFEGPEITALKGLFLGKWGHVYFIPLADGTYSAELEDGSDFRVMERGICRDLMGNTFCGDSSTSPWGL